MKMKLIGKGTFTKCFRLNEKEVVLHSECHIKECMALGWFPESDLFPKVEQISYGKYKMKYYKPVRGLKSNLSKKHWELYKTLRKLSVPGVMPYLLHEKWIEQFETIPNKFKKERKEIIAAYEACCNYGNIGFEISPRNVRAENNKLILLDCFFSVEQLYETRMEKLREKIQNVSCIY